MEHRDIPSDCFAHQKFLLNIFGLLSHQNTFYKLYAFSLLILVTIYPVSVTPEILKVYYVNFNEFIFSALFELGQITAIICMHYTFWNRSELKQLFDKLKFLDELLLTFRNAESGNIFIKSYKDIVRKQSYFGSSSISFVLITYISVSVALSLNKEKWILPFGCGPAIVNNNLQLIIQILVFGVISIVLYLQLFIYINVLTLICGHFKLLQKFIVVSFTGCKGDLIKEFNEKIIKKKIIDWASFMVQVRYIVPYHIGIIDAANQLESTFSSIILTFFSGVSIILCLLIYHIQQNLEFVEVLKDFILLVSGYSLLIVISSYGEKVTTESGKLANTCYEMDFADSDIRIQKSLMLIMIRSQKPIAPTIGKLRVLNLHTMLSIFQSIYTYYTFLRNMKSD